MTHEEEVKFNPQSMDAKIWAKEFNRILVSKNEQPYDEGWLIGWFANAIMAGYDEANRRKDKSLEPKVEEIKQILNGLKIEYVEGECDTCKGEKFYIVKNEDSSDRKVKCMFCADDMCEPTGKKTYPIISNFNDIAAAIVEYLRGKR